MPVCLIQCIWSMALVCMVNNCKTKRAMSSGEKGSFRNVLVLIIIIISILTSGPTAHKKPQDRCLVFKFQSTADNIRVIDTYTHTHTQIHPPKYTHTQTLWHTLTLKIHTHRKTDKNTHTPKHIHIHTHKHTYNSTETHSTTSRCRPAGSVHVCGGHSAVGRPFLHSLLNVHVADHWHDLQALSWPITTTLLLVTLLVPQFSSSNLLSCQPTDIRQH